MSPAAAGTLPCLAEFLAKLREEMELRQEVESAMARRAAREEMCMHMTRLADAQAKRVKYTETAIQTCSSIPPQVVNQLKLVHANIERTRVRVCAVSPRMHMDDFPRDGDGG